MKKTNISILRIMGNLRSCCAAIVYIWENCSPFALPKERWECRLAVNTAVMMLWVFYGLLDYCFPLYFVISYLLFLSSAMNTA